MPRAGGRTASPRAPPGLGSSSPLLGGSPAAAASWQLRSGGGGGGRAGRRRLQPRPPALSSHSGRKAQSREPSPLDLLGTQPPRSRPTAVTANKLAFHPAGVRANTAPVHLAACLKGGKCIQGGRGCGAGCPRARPCYPRACFPKTLWSWGWGRRWPGTQTLSLAPDPLPDLLQALSAESTTLRQQVGGKAHPKIPVPKPHPPSDPRPGQQPTTPLPLSCN